MSEPVGGRMLNGWKEIAEHLGRSVRTVQRWKRDLGLPVYPVAGGSSYSVYARADELDAWLVHHRGAQAPPEVEAIEPSTTATGDDDSRVAARTITMSLVLAVVLLLVFIARWYGDAGVRSPGTAAASTPAQAADSNVLFMTAGNSVIVAGVTPFEILETFSPPVEAGLSGFGIGSVAADSRTLVLPASEGVVTFDMTTRRFGPVIPIANRRIQRAKLSRDGRVLFVLDQLGRVVVIDTGTRQEITTVAVPRQIFDGVAARSDDGFFVTSRDAGLLIFLRAPAFSVETRLPTGRGAHDIATTSDGQIGFISNEYEGTLSCVDLDTRQVIGTATVGSHPIHLAVSPDDDTVYVANRDDDSVSVVNASTCAVRTTIAHATGTGSIYSVGAGPHGQTLVVSSFLGGALALDVSGPTARPLGQITTMASVGTIVRGPSDVRQPRDAR